ncbi:MAG: Rieske 2Fe-2S domain-containing protein [Myxococcales bacterium]|nr:Rieske 2Fe-2S domain-containing protein [Myxococcales bacterium]
MRRAEQGSQLALEHDSAVDALAALLGEPASHRLRVLIAWTEARWALEGWWSSLTSSRGTERDVGDARAFEDRVPRRVRVDDGSLMIVQVDGEWFATDVDCPHRGGDLSGGVLVDHDILCPVHGWAFSIRHGACRASPSFRLRTHRVRVVDGRVLVESVRDR